MVLPPLFFACSVLLRLGCHQFRVFYLTPTLGVFGIIGEIVKVGRLTPDQVSVLLAHGPAYCMHTMANDPAGPSVESFALSSALLRDIVSSWVPPSFGVSKPRAERDKEFVAAMARGGRRGAESDVERLVPVEDCVDLAHLS